MTELIKSIEVFIKHSLPVGADKIKITSDKDQNLAGIIEFDYYVGEDKFQGKIEIYCYS